MDKIWFDCNKTYFIKNKYLEHHTTNLNIEKKKQGKVVSNENKIITPKSKSILKINIKFSN